MRVAPAIWFAGALAASAVAAPVRVGPVAAELVADVESIAPGQPFTVAFRMTLDPPWHTYWLNPGDSGLAPTLAWSLPAGFTAGELEFPAPVAIATPPFMTYGHEGEVWFLSKITPPAQLPPAGVVLKAAAEWLICNEFCVPGMADLELSLPVVSGPDTRPSVSADAIQAARAQLPAAQDGWQFRARVRAGRYYLAAVPPEPGADEPTTATFFPFDPELLRHAAPQVWRREAAGYSLELAPAIPAAPPPQTLAGVLVLSGPDSRRAFRVDAPFSEDSPRPTTTERKLP
jgi:thiol:disulfide interchange protein DsbD